MNERGNVTTGHAIRLGEISKNCSDLRDALEVHSVNNTRLLGDVVHKLCDQVSSLASALKEMEDARVERSLR